MALIPLRITSRDLDRIKAGETGVLVDALQAIIANSNQQVVQLGGRLGKWLPEAYAAANFTSALAGTPPVPGANWTVGAGNQLAFQYHRVDDLVIVEFLLEGTAIGALNHDYLCIRLPAGFYVSAVLCTGLAHARYDAGGPSTTKMLPIFTGRGLANKYLPDKLLIPFDAGAGLTTWPTNRTLDLRGSIALQISSPSGSTAAIASQ